MIKMSFTVMAAALALAGCSEYSRSDRTVGGGVLGAATGAVIGGVATGSGTGAAIGAAVGGVSGAAIGAATTPNACYATDPRGRPLRDSYGNPVTVQCP